MYWLLPNNRICDKHNGADWITDTSLYYIIMRDNQDQNRFNPTQPRSHSIRTNVKEEEENKDHAEVQTIFNLKVICAKMTIFDLKEMVLSEVYGSSKDSIAVKELETDLAQFEVGSRGSKAYRWFLFFFLLFIL